MQAKKAPSGAFLLYRFQMIKLIPLQHGRQTSRDYLSTWYQEPCVVVTDNLCVELSVPAINRLLEEPEYYGHHRILDITHNPARHWPMNVNVHETLTNNIDYFYTSYDKVKFLPLFMWMFSTRQAYWWQELCFDAGTDKTIPIMCFNNQPRYHRTLLREKLLPVVDRMIYTIDQQGLPEERVIGEHNGFNDVGVSHRVYNQCAVNLVTETAVDQAYISEKACKPFVAHQIPIIVGSARITQFLSDVGLDMFDDLIPWQTWDSDPVLESRIEKIAAFVTQWINSNTILSDYQRVLPRVIRNKQYFHSDEFRQKIMYQWRR